MSVTGRRTKELFVAALEHEDGMARQAFLDRECTDDIELRKRLDVLLQAHDAPASVLSRPFAEIMPETLGPLPTAPMPRPSEASGLVFAGRYKLIEEIGTGGMGTVWMAQQQEPVKRLVALKLIKPGMDSSAVLARFEAERQALALMDHVNIAKVLDAGAAETGRPYFVMDLVRGAPITTYCDEHQLTPRQRLELFIPVCRAVQHAHQKGIIHRDLKPSNVLVALYDGKPVPKVIDFGVAKAAGQSLTERTLVTGFGNIVGTLEYMSPEQAELNQLDIDTRSDIYSLGVLLYELLTGSPPFCRKELNKTGMLEMLRVIRQQEPSKPSTRLSTAEGLPILAAKRGTEPAKLTKLLRGELDWIVMKALEKERGRRYETANGLAQDLSRYLADEPVQACPPSAAYRLRKFVRRNKGPATAAALVLMALVAGIIGTTWGMLRATDAEAAAMSETNQKEIALLDKEAALADAKEKLLLALVDRARAARTSGRVGQRYEALKAIRAAAQIRVTPELRTEAIAVLVLPDVEVAQEWEGWTDESVGVNFDGAMERYARLDKRGGVTVCRRHAEREEILTRLPPHGKPQFGGPWMSPDGRFVAFAHSWIDAGIFGGVGVWKLDGNSPTMLLDEPAGVCESALAFHPSGRQLAVGHADKSVSVYDLPTGRRLHHLVVSASPHALAFHQSERRLAVAAGNAVWLFDTDTGRELATLRHASARTRSVAWRPDGRRVAAGCNDGTIHVWDIETGAEVMAPWHHGDAGLRIAFNPAGDRLVSVGWGQQTWLWDAAAGQPLLKMPGNIGLQFNREGDLVGYSIRGNRLQLWQVACGREMGTLRGWTETGQRTIRAPVVHGDGQTVAAASDGALHFFDLGAREQLASVRMPHHQTDAPLFFHAPRRSSGPKGAGAEAVPGGWVTGGLSGLLLWPTRADPARPGSLSIGPPQPLDPDLQSRFTEGASASSDGRVVAAPDGRFVTVVHREQPGRRLKLGPQFDVRFTAVSPDGRWVVTGSHWEDGRSNSSRVWDATSGQQIHELALVGSTMAEFSPDSRWLMTRTWGAARDSRLWEAGTWREVWRSDWGTFAFSPDSQLLAIGDVFGAVRLLETATGREVARLTGSEPMTYQPECFTPDGTRLIAYSSAGTLHVWDLRLIRRQLRELGLDWDWPELVPADPASQASHPRRVEVALGQLAKRDAPASNPTPEERARQAIERYSREIEANPDSAVACNNLAWAYLTAPEPLRNTKAAQPLAEKAVRLQPGSAVYRNTLGVAHYRAGRYREAIETLRPNLHGQQDWALAFDLYFLAMSHHGLGEAARARDYYDLAVRWTRAQRELSKSQLEELFAFRAETEALLEIGSKKD
jgi:eukaryotic-like serine/threonine-protein kinase